jgi:hypothetical protein
MVVSRFVALTGLVAGSIASLPAQAAIIYRTVAIAGTQAPGTPSGALFSSFTFPSLDSLGHVIVWAKLQPDVGGVVRGQNDNGIWSEETGSLSPVALAGSQSPGTPAGANFLGLDSFLQITFGETAFGGVLALGGGGVNTTNQSGIWAEAAGSVTLVARTGSQAPGLPSGRVFTAFDSVLARNPAGHVAFTALVQGIGHTIWTQPSGALTLIASQGAQAPGTPVGTTFNNFLPFRLNGSDHIVFRAVLGGVGVTPANFDSLWSDATGALTLVARQGDQAPNVPSGANFRDVGVASINNVGQVAFAAELLTGSGGVTDFNDSGIWRGLPGALSLVVREGDQAPDTPAGADFDLLTSVPTINGAGHIAFMSGLKVGSGGVTEDNQYGIWSDRTGPLALVVRAGTQAPGAPAGANFFGVNSPTVNAGGFAAFTGSLAAGGGIDSTNDAGLWAQNPNGILTLVARKGDLFDVAPGDHRTISGIGFQNLSGGEDGMPVTFNDDFTLTFQLQFTDGTGGIFTATLPAPEPSTLILTAIAAALGAVILRKRSLRSPTFSTVW